MDFMKEIHNQYHDYMFSLAMEILRSPQFAEDAIQDAYLKIFHNREQIDDIGSFKTRHFIHTLTKNAAIDIYRQRSHIWLHEISVAELGKFSQRSDTINQELYRCIMDLPALYREVMTLKYSYGYSCHEIGKILSIKEAAVRKRLERGRKMIEIRLKKEGIL